MEIKDIEVQVERLDEVRGGNYAANYSQNGPVLSLVGVSAGHTNGSDFNITNTVVQQNTTTQDAFASSQNIRSRTLSLTDSQLFSSPAWGRFKI